MLGVFLCKTLFRVRCYNTRVSSPTSKPYFLQNCQLSSSTVKYISSTSNPRQQSFTVSYLINKCGFSPKAASSASNYVRFETPEKPDSVIAFFRNQGFSLTQISNVIRRYPSILLYSKETLLPKIEFLYSKGMSATDLAKALSSVPCVLGRSLKDRIIPSFNFCKSVLGSDDNVISTIKRFPDILGYPLFWLLPNIEILRGHGAPESNIIYLLSKFPRTCCIKPDGFREVVEEVKQIGINPLRMNFVLAIHAKRSVGKSKWEKKVNIYRKWGWSEEEILLAFVKHPFCMMSSEKKIMAAMDTFVNKMGWESSRIARRPLLISLSLEKRILPRCSIIQVLLSKGLIKGDFSFITMLESPERLFLQKFVTCYEDEASHLLMLYQEKLNH